MDTQLGEGISALEADDWDRAHEIAQDDHTQQGSWLHGIVHRAEGDEGNARYWYARAGRHFDPNTTVEAELAELRSQLVSDDF
ncbi:MAG: hypothetical protein U0Q12_07870 [Vicinamibacterales bacterium]